MASRFPDTVVRENQPLREVFGCLIDRRLVEAAIFVSSPSLMFGAIDVLLPLRVDALGGGHALIAGGFIGGAAIESVLAPLAGRMSDRIGRRGPYVLGMAICAVSMVVFGLAGSLPVVILSLLICSLGSGFCFAPAMTLISDAAEASGLHQGYGVGVTNMAWAAAQVLGGVAGAAIAGVTGDGVPSIAIAVLLVLTILYAFRSLMPQPVPVES
jgi:MFS family permease